MEAQKHPGLTAALTDQPLPTSALQPAQAPSALSQSSTIPPQEQALSQPVYLKALTIPLYQPVQPGCFQPSSQLVAGRSCGNLDSSNIPLILNPLVPSEGADQPQSVFQKQLGQTLTLNIVSTLPVLSSPHSSVSAPTGSPGKSKSAGKYICKHCGRDCLKPSVLEKHIRSHTGERPFPCTTCGIAFKTQSNLYKHRRTQTHVNNTKLPSDPDNTGIAEQSERATESITSQPGTKGRGGSYEDGAVQVKPVTLETSAVTHGKKLNDLSAPATSNSSADAEGPERTHQPFSSKTDQEVSEKEPLSLSCPVDLPNSQCQAKKVQEQRTPAASKHVQLQRQQATSSEKQWDYKPLDCKLKKCESTDSGYLSRSDSTEQQLASSSPLHSLCEHSAELENETALSSSRCTGGSGAKAEPAEKATASMLEKKRLEEHISKLISHNKIVVDDTQLDNVRPRKTVLSKQGSIDLPMPYTYKDSFHFDIRTSDTNRKKNLSLCSAKSTIAPLEKCKPVFFHSVPTQFSTTIDAVPVTRSNSLPFVEGTRAVHDNAGCSKPLALAKQSVNAGAATLLPSNKLVANSVDFPSSHPRALVRQTAVDDLPLSNVAEHPPPSEELQVSTRLGAAEPASAKNKKHSPRKPKMFSQEKWQMYGDETFKKIYQKMKSSQHARKTKERGNKSTDITGSTPGSKEAVSSTDAAEEKDVRSSASDSLSSLVTTELNTVKSETGANGNHIPHSASSEETTGSLTSAMETSHSVNVNAHTAVSKASQDLCGTDTDKHVGGNNALPAPSSCERRLQNTQHQPSTNRMKDDCLPVLSSKWEESSPGKESSRFESDYKSTSNNYGNHNRNQETGRHALMPLWVHCSNRETSGKSQNLPSERKKLKVEVEKKENIISKHCPGPCSESSAVNEAEAACCTITPCLSTAPAKLPSKAEEQKLSTGINESPGGAENMDCIKTSRLPTKAVRYGVLNLLSHPAGISKPSSVGFLGPEFRGSDCDTFALRSAADNEVRTRLVKTGAPLFSDTAANASSETHRPQPGEFSPTPSKNAFSPKYFLKLPRDERNSDLAVLLRSEQLTPRASATDASTNPPCSSNSRSPCSRSNDALLSPLKSEVRQKGSKGQRAWNAHANCRTPVLCSPASSETTNTLTTGDGTFHKEEITRGAWKNKQNKNKLNFQKQTEEKWMSITTSSAQSPEKKVCFTSVYSGGFVVSADIKEEKALHQLCSGGDSLVTASGQREASSKDMESTVMGWDTGGSPCILKDTSPTSEDMGQSQSSKASSTYLCHSFGMFYCHALTTHCEELPAQRSDSLTSSSESFTVLSTKSTFPSLNAETRLTWCCLTKSLPLPAEQKGNADSAYSSMHTHRESSNECTLSKYDISIFKMKNVSKTVAYGLTNRSLKALPPSFSQGQQMQELCSAAPGGAFKNTSEKKKKPSVCKKEKPATNKPKRCHKQKRIKIPPKWYGGRHIHGYTQLKMNRLNRRHGFPNRTLDALRKGYSSQACKSHHYKKCHSPRSKLQESYLHQQKDSSCSASDKLLCMRQKEGKNNSGIFSHLENLNHVKQSDKEDKQDTSGQIREHTRTNSSFQSIAPLEVPMTTYSFPSSVNAAMQQVSSDAELCCLATQPLVLQRLVPEESRANVQTDSMASSFWSCPFGLTNTTKGDQSTSTNPQTTCPLSLGLEASQENVPNAELEIQSFGTLDSMIQASGRAEDQTEENTCSSSKENSTHGSQAGCLHSLGSKAESNLESTSLAKLPHTECTEQSSQTILHLHGAADTNRAHQQSQTYGKQHETVASTFKKPSVTLRSPEFNNYSATPSKTYKKRGLEMMRKQIRVEYDDTSSDDEDRLVIEI